VIERALQTLGLGPDATPHDIKQAYRDLAMVWHPDRFPKDSRLQRKAEENLKEINRAHEILRDYDPASRVRPAPWIGPYSAHDHSWVGAPEQSPWAPTCKSLVSLWAYVSGTVSRNLPPLWVHITRMMSRHLPPLRAYVTDTIHRGRLPLRTYIIGTIIAICLAGYLVEAPIAPHRRYPVTPANGPDIGAQEQQSPTLSARPGTREQIGLPTGAPPDGENRGEYGSREGAPDQGGSPSPAGGGLERSASSDAIPAPQAVSRGKFTVGSTRDEVLAVQGTPSESGDRVWRYGSSSVLFTGGRVAGWDVEPGSPLDVQMRPSRPVRTTKGYFTVGSTRDEVLAVQGTPSEFSDRVWRYGSSSVLFSDDRVAGWDVEPDSPLKVQMLPSRPVRTTKGYFTVGSTKDEVLAVQGTPTEFRDRVWQYGKSLVLFSGDRVTSWDVEPDSPLKVRTK